jgi:hypothetical protein
VPRPRLLGQFRLASITHSDDDESEEIPPDALRAVVEHAVWLPGLPVLEPGRATRPSPVITG